MESITKATLVMLIAFLSLKASAQISGPTTVCQGVAYTFGGGGGPHSPWSVPTGATIVSRSGTIWDSETITVEFTTSGTVTLSIYDPVENGPGWTLAQTWTLDVTVVSTGAIQGATYACPSTPFSLVDYSNTGDNFNWQSSPTGQGTWSTFATVQSYNEVSTSITQTTDFQSCLYLMPNSYFAGVYGNC